MVVIANERVAADSDDGELALRRHLHTPQSDGRL